MPSNSKEYQRAYRAKTKGTRTVVSVAMNEDDHADILSFAKTNGMPVSTLLREATLHQARQSQLQSPAVADELKELGFLLSNIANNMNQIAHHSNRVKHVVDENGVLERFMELDKLITDFANSRPQTEP